MEIRKQFKVNSAHIVRNCYSNRCKYSLHAHTAEIEAFFIANKVDRAGMVMDFGITKNIFKPFLQLHHDAVLLWNKDSESYRNFIKSKTDNWIELSFTPSAELLSAYIYLYLNNMLDRVQYKNKEDKDLSLKSIRYHETRTGWAESNNIDMLSILMDQKIVLMLDKMGPVPRKKLDYIENNLGYSITGDKPIIINEPEQQVK